MVLWPVAANRASSRGFYFCELAPAFLLIAAAIFLRPREHFRAATFLPLAAWLVLGFFAASIAQQPKPKNYVLNVLNSGELGLHAPLRWHGILRDEPILALSVLLAIVANRTLLPSRCIKRFSLLPSRGTMARFFAPRWQRGPSNERT